ncbi:protein translocase subunit SecD [Clostridiaceae bacterium HSG29]|nr:protein translocase subunit SecD [Clostridiaceae bacterium HSG29]
MKRRNNELIFFLIIAVIAFTAFVSVYGLNLGSYEVKPISESIKLGLDIEGGVVVVYEAETDETGTDLLKTMNQVKSVMSNRIDEFGLTEPNITIQGENRIRIELPGVADTQEALEIIGKTAQLEFLSVVYNTDSEKSPFAMAGMMKEEFDYEEVITGNDVKDSFLSKDEYGKPAVGLELNDSGTKAFFEATKKGGQIAILLDGKVISAPSVNDPIPDGKAIISGSFTNDEASQLASLIRAGALPVQMNEIQTSVIGPTLGLDAMNKSVSAAKIGMLLIVLFLIAYYKLPGLVASISLMFYASIVMLIMVAFGATLTLPGIAGLVLSVGMAVDANVIIFERLKEELRNGKTVRSSINFAFHRAMKTILDANITTLIAGIVLFNFGQGPIKGFAVTLMIGILVSMFTAIVVTKAVMINGLAFKGFGKKGLYRA